MTTVDCTGQAVLKSSETIRAYRKRFSALARQASAGSKTPSMAELVAWFVEQDEAWGESSVRQYRASLVQAVTDHLDTNRISQTHATELLAHLATGPLPRSPSEKPRTSARKRKSVPEAEIYLLGNKLVQGDGRDDLLIARLLLHNCKLFLRPKEFQGARIEGHILRVKNAKASNGRANGEVRDRDLTGYPEIADLDELLATLPQTAAEAGGWTKLWGRLSSRLARVCRVLGIKRVSLYTTRHQGMANAKTWMTAEQLAAAAGHRSTRTAVTHYAHRTKAWRTVRRVALPTEASVAMVKSSPKARRVFPAIPAVGNERSRAPGMK